MVKKMSKTKCPLCQGIGFMFIGKYGGKFVFCPCCDKGNINILETKLICNCGKIATWLYLPSAVFMCCDDCVPRGCTCNQYSYSEFEPEGTEGLDWKQSEFDGFWEELDGFGRQLPCIEWTYKENGWDNLK